MRDRGEPAMHDWDLWVVVHVDLRVVDEQVVGMSEAATHAPDAVVAALAALVALVSALACPSASASEHESALESASALQDSAPQVSELPAA